MIKKIALTALAVLFLFACSAQVDSVSGNKMNYYIGVQANQLLNQLINLNANSVPVTNPYLIIASANSAKCGWGVEAGFGYNYEDITDQLVPANHESKIDDLFYRGGIGRKVMISKKFEVGYGLDYVGDYQVDQTNSSSVTEIGNGETDSTISVSMDKTTSTGWGAQFTLSFYITKKIILSTEATYYYLKSEIKENVLLTDYVTNIVDPAENSTTLSSSNSYVIKKSYTFSLPVALFLSIKF